MARKKGGKTLLCLLIAAFFLYLILGGSIEGAGKDGGAFYPGLCAHGVLPIARGTVDRQTSATGWGESLDTG